MCSRVPRSNTVEELLAGSVVHGDKRFNVDNEIAYVAQCHQIDDSTGMEYWHGYPVPWVNVPPQIRKKWISEGRVRRKSVNKIWSNEELEEYME